MSPDIIFCSDRDLKVVPVTRRHQEGLARCVCLMDQIPSQPLLSLSEKMLDSWGECVRGRRWRVDNICSWKYVYSQWRHTFTELLLCTQFK